MNRIYPILRHTLPPAVAVAFLGWWMIAEAGRGIEGIVGMSVLAAAIATSVVVPYVSLALILALLAGQTTGLVAPPGSTDWPMYLGILVVIGVVAATGTVVVRWVAFGVGLACGIAVPALLVRYGYENWSGWNSESSAFFPLAGAGVVLLLLTWASGYAVSAAGRLTAGRLLQGRMEAQLGQSEVELAVAGERNRIAQEMHDVLAHSLAVVVAQADGARYVRSSRPVAVDTALEAIATSARTALDDVRAIIDGIFDGTEPPQPGLTDIDDLVDSMQKTGLAVTFAAIGEQAALARGSELAIYRILQECFTNALRHRGRGSQVSVVIDWRGPGASLQIVSEGGEGELADLDTPRAGRGIVGMEERARLSGGWLTAGSEADGAFLVTAFLPYRSALTVAVSPMDSQLVAS